MSSHEATFDRLFGEYLEPIQRYCLRRLPLDECDDASAEVFLVAWRRIDEVPSEVELPWLYGIAHNVVWNHYRSRGRRQRLRSRLATQPNPGSVDPETLIVRRDDDIAILSALARLRPADQEIIRLKMWEELSNAEIAVVLGLSVRGVEMRFTRARKRLSSAYRAKEQRAHALMRDERVLEGGVE